MNAPWIDVSGGAEIPVISDGDHFHMANRTVPPLAETEQRLINPVMDAPIEVVL
jgi:hypothetical protein